MVQCKGNFLLAISCLAQFDCSFLCNVCGCRFMIGASSIGQSEKLESSRKSGSWKRKFSEKGTFVLQGLVSLDFVFHQSI